MLHAISPSPKLRFSLQVFMNMPLSTCEARDCKGLYKKARAGQIKGFTGIDDPYEAPTDPEILVETETQSAEDSAKQILAYLEAGGYLKA